MEYIVHASRICLVFLSASHGLFYDHHNFNIIILVIVVFFVIILESFYHSELSRLKR